MTKAVNAWLVPGSKASQSDVDIMKTERRESEGIFWRTTNDLKEEEEDYKLWPVNKSDRSWQSLSDPAKRHSYMSN